MHLRCEPGIKSYCCLDPAGEERYLSNLNNLSTKIDALEQEKRLRTAELYQTRKFLKDRSNDYTANLEFLIKKEWRLAKTSILKKTGNPIDEEVMDRYIKRQIAHFEVSGKLL